MDICIIPPGVCSTAFLPQAPHRFPPDKKCAVVDTEPMATETTVTRVGKNICVTREEAEADLAVVCK
jgi:hypothetical protein